MTLALAAILFVAFAVQATAGFGAGLLSLAVGTLFWPISELLPIVVPLALLLSIYVALRYWRHADIRFLAYTVVPLTGAGLLMGLLLSPHLEQASLRLLLGLVVCGAAARGIVSLSTGKVIAARSGGLVARASVLAAGVIHGLIATGGPLLVFAMETTGLSKTSFRSSLALVWIVLNGVMVSRFAITGALGVPQLTTIGLFIPVLISSTLLGEWLHSRVSERAFRMVVFLLLAVAGALLCAPMVLG